MTNSFNPVILQIIDKQMIKKDNFPESDWNGNRLSINFIFAVTKKLIDGPEK